MKSLSHVNSHMIFFLSFFKWNQAAFIFFAVYNHFLNTLLNVIRVLDFDVVNSIAEDVYKRQTQPAEPLTSWEIAKIFQSTHMRIFNWIARFYNAEASEDEKKEFEIAYSCLLYTSRCV